MTPPQPWRVPSSKGTSLQITNIMLLAWWTAMLIVNHDTYQRSGAYEALGIMPDVYWWAAGTGLLTLVCILPMLRWWRQRINHTYTTKTVGMIVSGAWWMFLAMIFLMAQGLNLGFGVHFALALGCIYESAQISRVGRS